MSNQGKVGLWVSIRRSECETSVNHWRQITSASNLNQVIFRKEADAALSRKLTSLFPGLGYAAGYKVRGRLSAFRLLQWTLLRENRYCRESTNTAVNLSSATILHCTMATGLIAHLERGPARLSCRRRQAGKCHPRGLRDHRSLPPRSIIGIGEIVLLPLDVLKIKRQTNPEAFRGRGVVRIVADEGMGLYRGAGWTAARNAPGSFAVRISCA